MSRPAIAMKKAGLVLVAADPYAEEQIDALPDGARLSVRVSKMTARGTTERDGMRGLWWAGLDLLAINVEHKDYDTKRKAHEAVLRGLGFVRPRYRRDKSIDMIPVSTSESEMDDDEFSVLMEKGKAFIVDRFGWDPWQMWLDEQEAMKPQKRHK